MFPTSLAARRKFNDKNSPCKFIAVIFTLSRLSGVFPFKLSSENRLQECNGILFIIFPLTLTVVNSVLLLKNFVDVTNEQYFTTIVQVITHANTIAYVFLPFFNKTRIQIGINACLTNTPELRKNAVNAFFTISGVFIAWIFFNILPSLIDWNLMDFLLFLEIFILGLLEMQMCFLLYLCNGKLVHVREEIKSVMDRKEVNTSFTKRFQFNIFHIGSLENARYDHLTVYRAMDNLNKAYGLANFLLTMRERFSFAYYLYCWISYGKIFDLMLASANFFRVFLVFYSFQALKNEERELKRLLNELDSEIVDKTSNQVGYLRKQIRLLNIKFEACGLFAMDLNMIISIITTTAGYLLLLNQLNL